MLNSCVYLKAESLKIASCQSVPFPKAAGFVYLIGPPSAIDFSFIRAPYCAALRRSNLLAGVEIPAKPL